MRISVHGPRSTGVFRLSRGAMNSTGSLTSPLAPRAWRGSRSRAAHPGNTACAIWVVTHIKNSISRCPRSGGLDLRCGLLALHVSTFSLVLCSISCLTTALCKEGDRRGEAVRVRWLISAAVTSPLSVTPASPSAPRLCSTQYLGAALKSPGGEGLRTQPPWL